MIKVPVCLACHAYFQNVCLHQMWCRICIMLYICLRNKNHALRAMWFLRLGLPLCASVRHYKSIYLLTDKNRNKKKIDSVSHNNGTTAIRAVNDIYKSGGHICNHTSFFAHIHTWDTIDRPAGSPTNSYPYRYNKASMDARSYWERHAA